MEIELIPDFVFNFILINLKPQMYWNLQNKWPFATTKENLPFYSLDDTREQDHVLKFTL